MDAVLTNNRTDYVWDLVLNLSIEGKMDILARLSRLLADTLSTKSDVENIQFEESSSALCQSEEVVVQLRKRLHPSTVKMLDECDWMTGRPFPVPALVEDDSWIDEAEIQGNSDIVSESVIQQNLQARHSIK